MLSGDYDTALQKAPDSDPAVRSSTRTAFVAAAEAHAC